MDRTDRAYNCINPCISFFVMVLTMTSHFVFVTAITGPDSVTVARHHHHRHWPSFFLSFTTTSPPHATASTAAAAAAADAVDHDVSHSISPLHSYYSSTGFVVTHVIPKLQNHPPSQRMRRKTSCRAAFLAQYDYSASSALFRGSSASFGRSTNNSIRSTSTTTTTILYYDNPHGTKIMMPPPPLPPLKNYYYLLRHGQSTANVDGIISSSRSLANSTQHGLTLLGIQQGKDAATSLLDLIDLDIQQQQQNQTSNNSIPPTSTKNVYFYSSPFARAKETAEACLTRLQHIMNTNTTSYYYYRAEQEIIRGLQIHTTVRYHNGLMERYFGRLDGQSLRTYAYVWPVDMFDPTHSAFDVESVTNVCHRIRETLLDIDSRHTSTTKQMMGGDHIVLTSHADVLQIMQVYAAGLDNVGKFSQYRFGNGEVRRMGRDVSSLPEAKPLELPPTR